ncbi:hypothetical protein BJX96DRAFT_152066 [Aspergillus floccosus]
MLFGFWMLQHGEELVWILTHLVFWLAVFFSPWGRRASHDSSLSILEVFSYQRVRART